MVVPRWLRKRFDASSFDLVVIWYPGKLSTLALKGKCGLLVKEYLIDHSMFPQSVTKNHLTKIYGSRRIDVDDLLDNIEVDIAILKSRIDAMNSLHESLQEDSVLLMVSKLTKEMQLVQLDLEEEKMKNTKLEFEINQLRKGIHIIKSHQHHVTHTIKPAAHRD